MIKECGKMTHGGLRILHTKTGSVYLVEVSVVS